jgi:predicted transcriptional regulator
VSVAASHQRSEPVVIPAGIESPRAKLVYLSLATAGRATVDELAEHLDMQKLVLFSVVGTLEGRGLVESDGVAYRIA